MGPLMNVRNIAPFLGFKSAKVKFKWFLAGIRSMSKAFWALNEKKRPILRLLVLFLRVLMRIPFLANIKNGFKMI